MSGIRALRKLQLFRESTPGTPGAATTIWRGIGSLEDQREVKFPREDIGMLSGTDRSYVSKLLGALTMESVEATFEQLPHIMEASIKSVGSGVADGVGSGKVYAYPFPTTAVPTIKTYTIEGGDNQEAERMSYGFVADFDLSAKGGEAWMVASNWAGRDVAVNAFTGALSIPSVEDILFGQGKLFIDAAGGTIGTTQKSNSLLEVAFKYTSGVTPRFTDSGLYFSHLLVTEPEAVLELTFEHNGNSTAEKINWRNQTPRIIRLLSEGGNLTTPGTAFTKKTLRIDLAGKFEKFDKIGEQEGGDIIKATFRAKYNATAALFGSITIVNEVASL